MSNRKLTKFPVISGDGTKYRVTIDERIREYGEDYVACRLYSQSKRWWRGDQFLLLECYANGGGVYDLSRPDYVEITKKFLSDWEAQAQRKSAAIDAFQAWDGRL